MEQPQQAPRTGEQLTKLLALTEEMAKNVAKNTNNIEKIDDKQDQLRIDIVSFMGKFDSVCRDTEELKKKINGNGNAGLEKRFEKVESRQKDFLWVFSIVGVAVISDVAVRIITLLQH